MESNAIAIALELLRRSLDFLSRNRIESNDENKGNGKKCGHNEYEALLTGFLSLFFNTLFIDLLK
jgi:hypothetical protein